MAHQEKVRHCYHGVYGAPLKGAPLIYQFLWRTPKRCAIANPPPTKISKTTQPVVLLPNLHLAPRLSPPPPIPFHHHRRPHPPATSLPGSAAPTHPLPRRCRCALDPSTPSTSSSSGRRCRRARPPPVDVLAAVDVLVGASPPTSPVSHRALPSPSLLLPPCPLPLCSIPSLLCLHLLFLPVRCLIKCQFKRLMQPRPPEHHDRVCDLVSAPPPSTTSSATASIEVSSSMDHFQAVGAILCRLFKLCCLEL
jgi:hypothetical protein